MTLFILESVKPGLRGELRRWMLEIHAGVFVGSISRRVRDILWERITVAVLDAQATTDRYVGAWLLHDAPNEQGYVVERVGDTQREAVDFDGLTLVRERK